MFKLIAVVFSFLFVYAVALGGRLNQQASLICGTGGVILCLGMWPPRRRQ